MSSFDELRDRSTAELERLLRDPDAPTRLHAAWALALRAAESIGEIAEHLEREPNEGVRAHLVHVIGGHEHRVLLRTLAEHDASPLVRAAACRVLARGADPELAAWLDRRVADDASPDVRWAIDDARGLLPPDPIAPPRGEPPFAEAPARRGEPRDAPVAPALVLRAMADLDAWLALWNHTVRYSPVNLRAIEGLPIVIARARPEELRRHRDALAAVERELDRMLFDREVSEEDPEDVERVPAWREARDAVATALAGVR